MKLTRGAPRALISFSITLILLGAVVVFAPPIVVRYALLHYLERQDIKATIDNVDINLFTGTLAIDGARGMRDDHSVFGIGHLALDLDYPALFDKQVLLSQLALSDSRLDVHRTADNTMHVAGLAIPASSSTDNSASAWQFGLSQLAVDGLTVRYSQARHRNRPALSQDIAFHQVRAADIEPWREDSRVSLDADVSADQSHLRLNGHAMPFARPVTARLHLRTQALDLDLLAPFIAGQTFDRLQGNLDSDQQIEASYDADDQLGITLDGSATWQHAGFAGASGLRLKSQALEWNGDMKANLLRTENRPGQFDGRGTLHITKLKSSQRGIFDFVQDSARWKGQAHATLGDAIQLNTDGLLSIGKTRLTAPDRLALAADQGALNGKLGLHFGARATHINTDGSFQAKAMTFARPGSLKFSGQTFDWHGKTESDLKDAATQIDTDGRMTVGDLAFSVPGTSAFRTRSADWQGTTQIRSADLFARQANGRLTLDDPQLDLPGTPLSIDAKRLIYQGRYAEQPDATGNALRLTMGGELDSQALHVMDTAIGAPWFAALQLHGADLAVDGLEQIRLAGLKASGVRILGDNDTPSSVLQAVSLQADSLQLADLAHYSADKLSIEDAVMHLRRTPRGMGVISLFLGSGSSGSGQSDNKPPAADRSEPASLAVAHLALSGPAVAFVDTAVTPHVHINGSDLNFTVEDLDTARLDHKARYRLSLDFGAYGHLDSRGTIAPMAQDGMNMDVDAWLRSLAMRPLSGYLDAAMGRRIDNGAADGTLHLKARKGKIDGNLNSTLSNFRLDDSEHKQTTIALGISLDSALKLVRGRSDTINFGTRILGDVTNPYFSIRNLVREAVLAGLRATLFSDYSPVGLLDRAKTALLNRFRSVSDRLALFQAGHHYVRPDDREYLGHIAQAMVRKPGWDLLVQGHANPGDAQNMPMFQGPNTSQSGNKVSLKQLAQMRGEAVRDYLAARNVDPDRIRLLKPVVDPSAKAKPRATFEVDKSP